MLTLTSLGIDTSEQSVLYLHKTSVVCRSEGFSAQSRICVTLNDRRLIAVLNMVDGPILTENQASLSTSAWQRLRAREGDTILLSHPNYLESQDLICQKINGTPLTQANMETIIGDLVAGNLPDIHIAGFLTACANGNLSRPEILSLTKAMITAGNRVTWPSSIVVDKHCVGGLPGNRTSMIIIPIVTAFGLMMPKTSSRAITSPSGTADTMEVLAPVELDLNTIQRIVEQERGCIAWGGSVGLSPADDLFIRVEKPLNIDSDGQLIASVLSKKIAAGSTHVVIDIPIGPTAKISSLFQAIRLKYRLLSTAQKLGVTLNVIFSDGKQPVGRGIGPALEARDVLAVLRNEAEAPQDLRDRALTLAGHVLEFSPKVKKGTGKTLATTILDTGQAFNKFQAICDAQGGMRDLPPKASYTYVVVAPDAGEISHINNHHINTVAKLAGAPKSISAGIELLTPLHRRVSAKQPLYIIHAETKTELEYAINYVNQGHCLVTLKRDNA